jgi:diacylglycerol kinase (ATP)
MKPTTSALSFGRIYRAAGYSFKGLRAAWSQEAAFRQELLAFGILVPLTLWLHLPRLDTVVLMALMGFVLVTELMNSGLEALVDKTSPEKHPLAGKAKDCGSAAVLVAVLVLSLSWLTLAGPALWAKLLG